jgi:hypothetical protein
MSFRTCDHVKEDGVSCDSAALSGKNFCYFHLNVRGRRLKMARALARGEACRIHLPVRMPPTRRCGETEKRSRNSKGLNVLRISGYGMNTLHAKPCVTR